MAHRDCTVTQTERSQGAHLRTAAVESALELLTRLQRENELDDHLAAAIVRDLRARVRERTARIACLQEEAAAYERMTLGSAA